MYNVCFPIHDTNDVIQLDTLKNSNNEKIPHTNTNTVRAKTNNVILGGLTPAPNGNFLSIAKLSTDNQLHSKTACA